MKVLTINLIGRYFHQIKDGVKAYEYRLRNPFWTKRLVGRQYDLIRICWGYPKKGDFDREMIIPWRGYELQTIQHEHFGDDPVEVFAIIVGSDASGTERT